MDVQQIDIVGFELLERSVDRGVKRLGVVTSVARGVDAFVGALEVSGELGRDDHLVAVASLLHPIADPHLGFFVLVVVL